jgi:hypothetical protein
MEVLEKIMRSLWLVFLLLGAIGLALAAPDGARAATGSEHRAVLQKQATLLHIQEMEPQQLGSEFVVAARLTTASGEPVPDKTIVFYANDVLIGQKKTGQQGEAHLTIHITTGVGVYMLSASFGGTQELSASKASAAGVILPAVITVQTSPPIPGVRFSLGGRTATTSQQGAAEFKVDRTGSYMLEMLPFTASNPDLRVELAAWPGNNAVPQFQLNVPQDQPVHVGLNVYRRVSLKFFDSHGDLVDPTRVSSIALRGSDGRLHNLESGEDLWLLSVRPVRRAGSLDSTAVLYSVLSVMVDGSNVVNQAQQRFTGELDPVWEIELLLFSARLGARDALFKKTAGDGIVLEYPDGREEIIAFGSEGWVEIQALARGLYYVTVTGVDGMAPRTPLAVARNQELQMVVVTHVNMAVVLSAGAAFALALLLIGRPRILSSLQTLRAPGAALRPADKDELRERSN